MRFDFVKLSDIADHLGLSVSTVSKALRGSREISEATKCRVNKCAEDFNYRPDPMGRSLKHGKSRSIGLVVSTIENQFIAEVINGAESAAYNSGFNIIIAQSQESVEKEIQSVKQLIHRSVDGLLISLSSQTQDISYLKKLQDQGFPIVYFDRVSNDADTHKICTDNYGICYHATRQLLASGFKQIAHISGSANLLITQERLAGYKQALMDANIQANPGLIKLLQDCGQKLPEVELAIQQVLSLKNPPDAILTTFERITFHTLTVLKKLQLNIPKDIGLIGYTNTHLAELLRPSLSTIRQPGFEMGQQALALLTGLISSNAISDKFEMFTLTNQLIPRASSSKITSCGLAVADQENVQLFALL